jgi:CRISPR-associated protein Cmr6
MNLPLPKETRDYFGNDKNRVLKISNMGLLFNKYVYPWQTGWHMEEKNSKEFRDAVSKKQFDTKYALAVYNRQKSMLQSLKSSGWHVEFFEATTDSRLIIGLGGTSVIETGMTLHPLYGFPYLPGSGLKGLARAFAEIAVEPSPSREELREIFGSEDKDPRNVTNNRQSKVFFMDGLPKNFPKLELDIMNPHHGEYYRGEKPPADYLDPVPVTFLAVAVGQTFSFAVLSKEKGFAEKAKLWLIGGLTELGAGGKTNVGYGYFRMESPTVAPQPVTIDKDNSLASRLKAVKNSQTFVEFMQGIKQDDIETLRGISLKGSVINIGFAGELESIEVSDEIKKIIANKILEGTTPNKKWDEKKHEKYKRLQLIAGVSNV